MVCCVIVLFLCHRTKVASTHGNHNVYVTDLNTGKNVNTLSGHPRTPWCITFHPSSNQILASGCLGGQVRVWDLHVSILTVYACSCSLNNMDRQWMYVIILDVCVSSLEGHVCERSGMDTDEF